MTIPAVIASAAGLDLSGRYQFSKIVAASPALAAETVIATLTTPDLGGLSVNQGIYVMGWAAYTVGTSGTAVNLRLRETGTSGSIIAATGALTKTAAQLYADDVNGLDTAGAGQQVYVLTMQVTSGAAASTVTAVLLTAIII